MAAEVAVIAPPLKSVTVRVVPDIPDIRTFCPNLF